jgi:hypothetical protein
MKNLIFWNRQLLLTTTAFYTVWLFLSQILPAREGTVIIISACSLIAYSRDNQTGDKIQDFCEYLLIAFLFVGALYSAYQFTLMHDNIIIKIILGSIGLCYCTVLYCMFIGVLDYFDQKL